MDERPLRWGGTPEYHLPSWPPGGAGLRPGRLLGFGGWAHAHKVEHPFYAPAVLTLPLVPTHLRQC